MRLKPSNCANRNRPSVPVAAADLSPPGHNEHAPPQTILSTKSAPLFFLFLGMLFIALAFLFNTPGQLFTGSIKILTSPANLLTDYIQLSNLGAAFLNAGIMTLASIALLKICDAEITGPLAAAVFTVAGFSFFGKNLYNSLPITFGAFLYAKLERAPFARYLSAALFGSSLGPLVSEISFNIGLPTWQGILLGIPAGIAVGIVLPPLTEHFKRFHNGFSLYATGFTAGIVGMFVLALLRSVGVDVLTVSIVSSGNNPVLSIFLYSLFFAMLLLGVYKNGWGFSGLGKLMKETGRGAPDFLKTMAPSVILINMALLGIMMTTYVLLMGGQLNGPTMGGIFTVAGFGAAGKHAKNVTPILAGIVAAKIINIYDPSSTAALLAALFGTTLAPIAGCYGIAYGAAAGFLHMAVTMNLAYLHGGMNLYNNGFSGGFIAAGLVPLIDAVIRIRKNRRIQPAPRAKD